MFLTRACQSLVLLLYLSVSFNIGYLSWRLTRSTFRGVCVKLHPMVIVVSSWLYQYVNLLCWKLPFFNYKNWLANKSYNRLKLQTRWVFGFLFGCFEIEGKICSNPTCTFESNFLNKMTYMTQICFWLLKWKVTHPPWPKLDIWNINYEADRKSV